MAEPQSQPIAGHPTDGPSVGDTPFVASTPADGGSDFYNSPWVAGTPVSTDDSGGVAASSQTKESTAPPNAPPLIPGLNLVNEGSQEPQPGLSGISLPNIVAGSGVNTGDNSSAHHLAAKGEQEERVSGDKDVMEVDQGTYHGEESAGPDQNLQRGLDGDRGTDGIADMSSIEATGGALDEQEDEHPEWEIDSSPYQSSSDSSSDSSSEDSDEEDEDYPILSPEEQARILMQGELGSDDEGEGKGKPGVLLKTANEIPEEVLPIPEIDITPEMKVVFLGNVEAVVENTVLIAANVSGEYQVLESGSLLCFEDRKTAGVVSETLGRVENPLYAVRYPTASAVEEHGLSRGKPIYYVEEHSTFVFTQPLKGLKGSDASNFHDEEVAEDEVEFSDDEAEAEYKRRLKQKRQERKEAKGENGGSARARRGQPGPSKLNQSELNYDDNPAEDGYTPLARPKNLHEMMRQNGPVETASFHGKSPNFRGARGRGRGSDRGRGARGRGGRDSSDSNSHHDRQLYYQRDRQEHQHQSLPPNPPPSQQAAYNAAQQQFPPYSHIPQLQPQQQQQGVMPTAPFNFQMPFQQAFQQPNMYQQMAPSAQINPLFLAALQQQQQQQYQQSQQQAPGQPQAQTPTMNFEQVRAQLDLLRQLSNNGTQWPPRS